VRQGAPAATGVQTRALRMVPTASPAPAPEDTTADAAARGWFRYAVGSLVLAGLLSLLLVVGRLPFLGWLFTDPLFFRRALVVHVDLAIVVWFQAGTLAFLALGLGPRLPRAASRLALALAGAGLAGMLAGAVMPGAEPVLANYVPVIDHPVYFAGLATWFAGAGGFCLLALGTPARDDDRGLAPGALSALRAAAAANLIALTTFAGAWRTTPAQAPAGYYEMLFWGGGHVLQAANAAALLGLWLQLARRWTGGDPLGAGVVRALLAALVLPQLLLPVLAFQGTSTTAYLPLATHLMRWTIFPPVLMVLAAVAGRAWRRRAVLDWRDPRAVGLAGSAALTVLGFILGALIRGSSTLVPGHYHCAIGAVTIALMASAYDFQPAAAPAVSRRLARPQLLLFGCGQAVFGLGFALAGAYGLGRKQYGAEQHVRSAGEYLGLGVMGLGGLVAVAGGLLFLAVMLRHLRVRRPSPVPDPEIHHEKRIQDPSVAAGAR
jgi:cytochrome c oxidase subunit 1